MSAPFKFRRIFFNMYKVTQNIYGGEKIKQFGQLLFVIYCSQKREG
jgi:hypothetical protein